MPWGEDSRRIEGAGLCHACLKPKAGSKIGKVGGHGFGSKETEGLIACCVNPDCVEGKKTLADNQAR